MRPMILSETEEVPIEILLMVMVSSSGLLPLRLNSLGMAVLVAVL